MKDFLEFVALLDWPGETASLYVKIRAQLQNLGTPIGAMDLLIASHALFINTVLVTNNTREFDRAPDPKIENWLSDTTSWFLWMSCWQPQIGKRINHEAHEGV